MLLLSWMPQKYCQMPGCCWEYRTGMQRLQAQRHLRARKLQQPPVRGGSQEGIHTGSIPSDCCIRASRCQGPELPDELLAPKEVKEKPAELAPKAGAEAPNAGVDAPKLGADVPKLGIVVPGPPAEPNSPKLCNAPGSIPILQTHGRPYHRHIDSLRP